MSVATAVPRLTDEPAVPDEMSDGIAPRGVALSVALHLVLGAVFVLGLPRLFDPPMPEELPVAAQLGPIGPEPRAPTPVPPPPTDTPPPPDPPNPPDPKPPPPQPVLKPEPKPEPPKPAEKV